LTLSVKVRFASTARVSVALACLLLFHALRTAPSKLPSSSGRGVTIAMATYKRIALLKLTIPIYLQVPIIRDIVISDDFNSGDAQALRDWLPTSGISLEDQVRRSSDGPLCITLTNSSFAGPRRRIQ
jgi:hypothetical protein